MYSLKCSPTLNLIQHLYMHFRSDYFLLPIAHHHKCLMLEKDQKIHLQIQLIVQRELQSHKQISFKWNHLIYSR